jgi:hypothetical protein
MVRQSTFGNQADFCLRKPLREAAGLLLVAVIVTGLSWVLRTDSLVWRADPTTYEMELSAPLVDLPEALRLFDEGDYLFIDTRAGAAEAEVTISGAFIIREKFFDDDLLVLMDDLFPEDPIVLFGNGELSGVSNITNRLQNRGYENILILRAGLHGWQKAGGDVSPPFIMEMEEES